MNTPQVPSLSHRRRGAQPYTRKILKLDPIAYWPLNETSGSVARCLVNPAQNGAYTGVDLANAAGPDGSPCPFFDGANDYVNIYTATLNTAFNGALGSAMIWFKVANVGVWTDAVTRYALSIVDDGTNLYRFEKRAAVNDWLWIIVAGAGNASGLRNGITDTAWVHTAITWSDPNHADEAKCFWNGAQNGATSAALNVWAGDGLSATQTNIGAGPTTPANVFHGWLAHAAVWDRVLTPAEIASLATL